MKKIFFLPKFVMPSSSLAVILSLLIIIFAGFLSSAAYATGNNYDIKDQASCLSLPSGNPSWNPEGNMCSVTNISLTLNSGQTLTVEKGTGFVNSGTYTISSSGIITISSSGTITSNSGGTINNFGEIDNNPGGTITINNSGAINNSATFFNSMGTIIINPGGTIIDNSGSTINNVYGSTITINPGGTIIDNSGSTIINQYGGTITNSGTIKNSGTITINNSGNITNYASGTITNSGTKVTINNLSSGTITNSGTIIDSSNGVLMLDNDYSVITNSGTINNLSGGTIINDRGGSIYNTNFINNPGGAIYIAYGANITNLLDATITNSGTITNYSPANDSLNLFGGIVNYGTITNYDTIANYGTIYNTNTIDNYCKGAFTDIGVLIGNPVVYLPCFHIMSTTASNLQNQPASGIASAYYIPSWIKNTAKYWSQNQLSDSEFVKSVQYLVDKKIIQVPQTTSSATVTEQTTSNVPSWVKNTAGMWATGKISDQEFLSSVQYLVSKGMIKTGSAEATITQGTQQNESTTKPLLRLPLTVNTVSNIHNLPRILPCINTYAQSVPNTDLPPKFVTSWNSLGSGLLYLKNPTGIALDSCGNVYVTDTGNHEVEKFNSNGLNIDYWGGPGSTINLSNPTSINVDSTARIWVSDGSYVVSFDQNGQNLSGMSPYGTICCKSSTQINIPFTGPLAVAVDSSKSDVVVTDMGKGTTSVFDYGGNQKKYFAVDGYDDAIALDSSNAIWMAGVVDGNCVAKQGCFLQEVNAGGNMVPIYVSGVESFSLDHDAASNSDLPPCNPGAVDVNGKCIFPPFEMPPPYFTPPIGRYAYSAIALDSTDRVFLADSIGDRILVFDSHGNYITSWGSKGSGNAQFNNPTGIAVDKFDDVYVVDSGNNRIEKFTPSGP